jgi:RNA polymerase sigma-70 factor (ECF subfamily)
MSSDTISVHELLERARQGGPEDRDRLFQACRPYLGMVAQTQMEHWLQAKVDASDLVQETMLEAYRDFDRFSGQSEGEWLGWLKRILAHNVADYIRRYRGTAKRQVGREVPLGNAGDETGHHNAPEPAARIDTPSRELMRKDNQLRIAAALAQLPADYQEVIRLRNLEKLPFDQVAEQMGRSRPAVQMLWMRALRKLQEITTDPDVSQAE